MVEKDRIIQMRKEAGMKQVEFAEYFAIPVRTLQEWEHDRRTPPEYLVRFVCLEGEYDEILPLYLRFRQKGENHGCINERDQLL